MDYSLSNSDIQMWLPHANILTYPQIATAYKRGISIFDLMGPAKTLVLLYLTKANSGHWTCVFERTNGDIECFDSLGYCPDDELNFVPHEFQHESNQNHTFLLALLAKANRRIIYNDVALQETSPDICTCGRWVVCRIALRDMPIEKFVSLMRSCDMPSDEIVTLATS